MPSLIAVFCVTAVILTIAWLDKRVDRAGLVPPARFGLALMVWLGGLLFPLTWLVIGTARMKRRWRA